MLQQPLVCRSDLGLSNHLSKFKSSVYQLMLLHHALVNCMLNVQLYTV